MHRSELPRARLALAGIVWGVLLAGCLGSDPRHESGESEPRRSTAHPGLSCELMQVPARDGTLLATYVYRADAGAGEPQASIVARSPYGREFESGCFSDNRVDVLARYLAANGYVFITQMARGTFNSQGRLELLTQERADGYDLVEWVTGQDWSNGSVGVWGASYLGLTAWQTALSNPPGLRAVVASLTAEDYHREWVYVNGVPALAMNLRWPEGAFTADQLIRQARERGQSQDDLERRIAERAAISSRDLMREWARHLPLSDMPHFRGVLPDYYVWLEHPYYDAYWEALDVETGIAQLQIPALITGAWYDLFVEGTVSSYINMKQKAGSKVARDGTKLVVTPYGHAYDNGTPTFGPRPDDQAGLHRGDILAFFDRYVKGIENGYDVRPNVRISVMVPPDHGNEGHAFELRADQFPLPDTELRELFLASGGRANSRSGDGVLSSSPARDAGASVADRFRYDPNDPVPTAGGNLSSGRELFEGGPQSGAVEQAAVEARQDVLVYTSAPFAEEQAIVGPVSVRLFASSSAPDTDFTAKLVDVRPDGATHNIVDGVVRARLRAGSRSQPSLIEPNQVYEYSIPLGHTAVLVPAGHRLRLQISSSNFPYLARNLNTGRSNEDTAEIAIADQTILHDAAHPSRLILPVARGVQGGVAGDSSP